MPTWLKYVVSIGTGFLGGLGTAQQSGAGTKGSLIGGADGAVIALGNLSATAPKDEKLVKGN